MSGVSLVSIVSNPRLVSAAGGSVADSRCRPQLGRTEARPGPASVARLVTVMDWLCGYEYGGLLRNTRVTQLMVGSQTQRDMGRCCGIALI